MKQDTKAVLDTPSLQIGGTRFFVSPHEIFFLTYPIDISLHDFIVKDILTYNCTLNPRYRSKPPAKFIIGIDQIHASLSSRLFDIYPEGNTIASPSMSPEVLLECIYQVIKDKDPACVILVGFSNIFFNQEGSPSEIIDEISMFLSELKKIQNQFHKPILITTKVHPRNGDLNFCVLEVNGSEFEISTDRHENIQAPFGYFKLLHIPRENPNPVKLFRSKSGPVTRKR
jgi:hypothetical protein